MSALPERVGPPPVWNLLLRSSRPIGYVLDVFAVLALAAAAATLGMWWLYLGVHTALPPTAGSVGYGALLMIAGSGVAAVSALAGAVSLCSVLLATLVGGVNGVRILTMLWGLGWVAVAVLDGVRPWLPVFFE